VDVSASVDRPAITSWNNGDARLRFLTLDGVHVNKATPLVPSGPSQSLVRGPHETLVADASTPGRSGTLIGFDLAESDWPLKASFVLFVRNVVEQARAHRTQGATGTVRAGEPMRIPVPADATEVSASLPGVKDPIALHARDGLAVVPDTSRAGHYLVSWKGPHAGSTLVPVSLTSERESDLRKKAAPPAQAAVTKPAAELADAHTDWSYVAALLALALVAADAWWLTRRPRARAALPRTPAADRLA
jgi:hypothetical protein